jgi:hypothetical protein
MSPKRQIVCDELGYAIHEPLGAYNTVFDTEFGGLSQQNNVFLEKVSWFQLVAVVRTRNASLMP